MSQNTNISKSRQKRESFNYRAAYFKKNPGLFGCIWFCSQCNMPLIGKENVQVDHIVPLAGMGINRTVNTVAICPACNRKKSAKGGIYVVKGGLAQIREVILFTLQKIIMWLIVFCITIIHGLFSAIWHIITLPFSFTDTRTKIIAVMFFIAIIIYLLH